MDKSICMQYIIKLKKGHKRIYPKPTILLVWFNVVFSTLIHGQNYTDQFISIPYSGNGFYCNEYACPDSIRIKWTDDNFQDATNAYKDETTAAFQGEITAAFQGELMDILCLIDSTCARFKCNQQIKNWRKQVHEFIAEGSVRLNNFEFSGDDFPAIWTYSFVPDDASYSMNYVLRSHNSAVCGGCTSISFVDKLGITYKYDGSFTPYGSSQTLIKNNELLLEVEIWNMEDEDGPRSIKMNKKYLTD